MEYRYIIDWSFMIGFTIGLTIGTVFGFYYWWEHFGIKLALLMPIFSFCVFLLVLYMTTEKVRLRE